MSTSTVEFHPAANIFPMMDDVHLRELADDIRKNGQREWVVFYEGKLLDGRNRWKACELAGVEPTTCEIDSEENFDPVAYVLSVNLHRRHLTVGQKATVANNVRMLYEKAAKERQKVRKGNQPGATVENFPQLDAGKARDAAGRAVGVSGKAVDQARIVAEHGSKELIAAVEAGEVAISKAAKVAKELPKREQLPSLKQSVARDDDKPADPLVESLFKRISDTLKSEFAPLDWPQRQQLRDRLRVVLNNLA